MGFTPESVVGAGVRQLRETVQELRLHGVLLVPHLAVDADVPVLVHHDVVIAVVQHAQALQAGGRCGHRVRRLTRTIHPALRDKVVVLIFILYFIAKNLCLQ